MRVHLSSAMALVLHDLEKTGAPIPLIEESDWQDYPGAESAFLRNLDGTGMGVWVDTGASEAEQIAMLADQVQEWVVELADHRVTNWPRCPEHPHNHPMAARANGDTAAWECPQSRRQVIEIGRLALLGGNELALFCAPHTPSSGHARGQRHERTLVQSPAAGVDSSH